MKKQLIVGVVLGLVAGGVFILTLPDTSVLTSKAPDAPGSNHSPQATAGAATAATAASGPASSYRVAGTVPLTDGARRVLAVIAAASAATPGSAVASVPATQVQLPPGGWEKPPLTRTLPSGPTIHWTDRPWAVLGTQDYSNANGRQTALALQDQTSGQVEYRQSALRVVLEPGVDYEAFIRERHNASRLFVNSLYGDLAVDAAHIAAEYNALAKDPRVAQLAFIPLVTPIKPR